MRARANEAVFGFDSAFHLNKVQNLEKFTSKGQIVWLRTLSGPSVLGILDSFTKMAKGKAAVAVQNRPMYSRISFLQQAATYLTLAQQPGCKTVESSKEGTSDPEHDLALRGRARLLVSDLRSVSLKTRIRLTSSMKQTICRFCDAILVEGESCTTTVENQSKGGRKSWADVLVRKCHACGNVKRHPINVSRQKSKAIRLVEAKAKEQPQAKAEERSHEKREKQFQVTTEEQSESQAYELPEATVEVQSDHKMAEG